MVDFINEVEEELRKDEYNRLLRRYGPFLLAVIVAIVAVAGFLEFQKYTKDQAARATSASYIEASDKAAAGDIDQSIAEFLAIADKAPAGYAGLSLMRAASLKLEAGDSGEALRLLDRAANTFDTERHKQLAQIKAAYILANDGAYSDVVSRAAPLMEKDAPYEFLARELVGFAGLKSGDEALARERLALLDQLLSLRDDRSGLATLFSRTDHATRIEKLLSLIRLEDRRLDLAADLSHGQKQWLEIGMLLIQDPELLMLDEPVAGMSVAERKKTAELLNRIIADRSVIVIEHDMGFVADIATRVTVLHQGKVLSEGSMERVQNDPKVIEVYLGH